MGQAISENQILPALFAFIRIKIDCGGNRDASIQKAERTSRRKRKDAAYPCDAVYAARSPLGNRHSRTELAHLCRTAGISYLCFFSCGRIFSHT